MTRSATTRDVLDDLGFSRSEASALKVKASILEAILAEIERRGLSQRQLVEMLDEYQPNVSNLLHGRISKVSIEKLLRYAQRLGMRSRVELRPSARATRKSRTRLPEKRHAPSAAHRLRLVKPALLPSNRFAPGVHALSEDAEDCCR